MKKMRVVTCLFWACFLKLSAQATDKDKVLTLLENQRQAWNRGSIEDYMEGYWESDSLKFIGSGGITYGYQQILSNYQHSYSDKDKMGALQFDILHTEQISADHFFVIGKWMIIRKSGNLSGHFSLLLRKIDGEWKIVADHSS